MVAFEKDSKPGRSVEQRIRIIACCLKHYEMAVLLAGLALVGAGCSVANQPRPRMGSYATSTPGTNFIGLTDLGAHNYDGIIETNGIVYTCRGGHVDIAHLRIAADHVRYLYGQTYKSLMRNKRELSFKLNVDRSHFFASFSYPSDWKTQDKEQKDYIARAAAFELAQYFSFVLINWHEVLTFYGYKTMGVLPEFPSAFSWEDTYSNTIGVHLGARAIHSDTPYDEAMTTLLREELEYLGIQSADVARGAAEQMRGQWYDGNLLVTMHVRNTDIGLHDGLVWPMLVPGVCQEAQPLPYPAPQLDVVEQYGIGVTLEVEPREFERGRILRIVYPDGGENRINIDESLPVIMAAIEAEIIEKHGAFFRDGRYFEAREAGAPDEGY